MHWRRLAVSILTIAVLTTACKSDTKTASAGADGAVAPASPGAPAALDPLDPAAPASTIAGGSAPPTSAGRTATTVRGGAATTLAPGATADPHASAQVALDQYLDGLRSENYSSAMAASGDGPRLLAFVRSLLKSLNTQAGAASTFDYTERTYAPAAVTADRVVFSGRALLKQTTTTKSGERKEARVPIGEIGVVRRSDRWFVTELVWEGKPVEFTASTSRADVGNGVTARLAGNVRFGTTSAVVLSFETDRQMAIRIEKDRLKSSGFEDASTFRALVQGYAYFTYPRRAGAPRAWSGDVTVQPGSARPISMNFG
ncbi:MAG TPA: hypothetical protein VNB24_07555 [Acidimicrobiales bacterium]|nr:hypothetical protein [Acidimicrobiales bacterium]